VITQLSTQTLPRTPAVVQRHLDLTPIEGDCPIDEAWVGELSQKLEHGLFHSPTWAVAECNGKKYRINGQHSATMLARANGAFPTGLAATLHRYKADDKLDLASLYQQYDNSKSSRTHLDVLRAHGKTHRKLNGMTPWQLSRAVAGISMVESDRTGEKIPLEKRVDYLHAETPFVAWSEKFIGHRSIMTKVGCVGAMYSTWSKDPGAAEGFWTKVQDKSHPSPTHPTRKYADELLAVSGRLLTKGEQRELYCRGVYAWNAFRNGQSVQGRLRAKHSGPLPEAE
jgi:hypothetical protein